MSREIRAVIADDHPLFRQGLVMTIASDREINIVGEADDGQMALDLIEEKKPDVVILDVDMPVLDGIDVARKLKEQSAPPLIIFLTMHKDKSILRSLKKLEIKGYVLKDGAINEIIKCIKTVIAGNTYLSPALNDLILSGLDNSTDAGIPGMVQKLTATEKKVLGLITTSKTNREIADALFVSIRTVESHRYSICQKLNLKGAHALLVFATENRKKILHSINK